MNWKRFWKWISGVVVIGVWILTFPADIEEGTAVWRRWLGVAGGVWDEEIRRFLPYAYLIAVIASITWWLWFYPPAWWKGVVSRISAATTRRTSPASEVEHAEQLGVCRKVLVEWSRDCGGESWWSDDCVAASRAIEAGLERVGVLLDRQGIPHPPIEVDVVIQNHEEWITYLSKVSARHDDVDDARAIARNFLGVRGGQ